ncbi:hypothetical protein ACFE04_020566 [Oxalis oulophora]
MAPPPPPILSIALPSETGRVLSIQSLTVQSRYYRSPEVLLRYHLSGFVSAALQMLKPKYLTGKLNMTHSMQQLGGLCPLNAIEMARKSKFFSMMATTSFYIMLTLNLDCERTLLTGVYIIAQLQTSSLGAKNPPEPKQGISFYGIVRDCPHGSLTTMKNIMAVISCDDDRIKLEKEVQIVATQGETPLHMASKKGCNEAARRRVAHRVVLAAKSKCSPDKLYEGGLQRDLFLPFIATLKPEYLIGKLRMTHFLGNRWIVSPKRVGCCETMKKGKLKPANLSDLRLGPIDCSVLAYGLTSSDKTFTINGSPNDLNHSPSSRGCLHGLNEFMNGTSDDVLALLQLAGPSLSSNLFLKQVLATIFEDAATDCSEKIEASKVHV